MTALRVAGAGELAANLLTDPRNVATVEQVLTIAGDATAQALTSIGREVDWVHTLDFRCEPPGRHVDGMETAAVMDSHDELAGTMLVGCRSEAVDHLSSLLTTLDSGNDLGTMARAQEATNIIGSAYLNGLRNALSAAVFSNRCFLPSPPRFLRSSVENMVELAIGGQGLGDRGWIAEHRIQSGDSKIVVVWVPTSNSLVEVITNGTMS